ncbi:PTS system mannose/fructose/sorbose family transporter subunit IID [Microbacteriaceae bacterium 4G12]
MESNTQKLTKKDYINVALRSYIMQDAFNYTNYQGTGYANQIFPALKKIYKDDEEALKKATMDNIEFYNTNPHMAPFAASMQLAMLDHGESVEDVRSIKYALMGPLAGIGDSLAQFGLAPLFATIGAGLAMQGLVVGPILFLMAMILSMLTIKVTMGFLGFKLGTNVIDKISEKMAAFSHAANIIGITVISGLAVQFVKVNLAIEYKTKVSGGHQQVVSLQAVLDKIMPSLLPVVVTAIVYVLIRKYKWNTYKLVGLLIVAGILLSVLGVLK